MRRWCLAAAMILGGCGTDVVLDCPKAEGVIEKSIFVGPGDDDASDRPTFRATFTLLEAYPPDVEGHPVLSGTPSTYEGVWFKLTEYELVARGPGDATLAKFAIRNQGDTACSRDWPIWSYVDMGYSPHPSKLPWGARPWIDVDWSRSLVNELLRFDAAFAAGHPEVAVYQSVAHHDPAGISVNESGVSVRLKCIVSWKRLEDGTPGCFFDVPDVDPSAACPPMEITYRLDLEREPD